MKNLDDFNVQELSVKEQEITAGGLFGLYATFFVVGLLYGLFSD